MVTAANTTLNRIIRKVRQLTGLSQESQLSTSNIEEYINDFYTLDFPHALKTNELRNTFAFYTSPGVNRYTLTSAQLNGNLYLQSPFYVDGYPGLWFKTRGDFYAKWPRISTTASQSSGTGATGPYSFTISGAPLMPNEVFVSAENNAGAQEVLYDDGSGTLVPYTAGSSATGTVNYTTGAVVVTFDQIITSGTDINATFILVNRARPVDGLYFRDYIELRPVPDAVYKVEMETFQPPTDFLTTGENPTLNQWWEYLAYGAARKIMQDRSDDAGIAGTQEEFDRQASLIYLRTAQEYDDQRAATIYTSRRVSPGFYPGYFR